MRNILRTTDGGLVATLPQTEVKIVRGDEVHIRYTIGGAKFSLTEASLTATLQKAHHHKGLRETYVILSGEVHIIFCEGFRVKNRTLALDTNLTWTFEPEESHVVLPMPGALFLTTTVGTPVPNPERNNNDWWTVDSNFEELARNRLAQYLQ
jgi:mannose-6-phosphate isomerase-like protein (cupin superfamily)